MKKQLFAYATFLLLAAACNENKKTDSSTTADTSAVPAAVPDSTIVQNSVTSDEGKVLHLTFNNTANTLTAVLDADTIHLKMDTVASGISASNEQYKYTEWHGEVTLEKNGQPIFKAKQ